ncbi:MAG TPA: phosphate ABC transporter substrate-binding protein PstS [Tepidisphaeraceae bacterium]|nr:phosphate ABC transporter substrate-binding protein PstS [Tepidisphaeraceae bacterium]
MTTLIRKAAVTVLAVGAGLAATSNATAATRIEGAGATFPNPIYQRWVTEYQRSHPDVQINYQSIGSGGGIKGIINKTVDFAGSDAPMSKSELGQAGSPVVHIPTVAGGLVPAYNLPGFQGELKLDGQTLAGIYMGTISTWNDPAIAALNEGSRLPSTPITPAWRTDGSGSTFVFTNYLATQSEEFKSTVGAGKSVEWPAGQGGKGSEGVAAIIQQTPGAIGYVELNYATQNKLRYASVKNQAGKFVKASPETVSAAGEAALKQMNNGIADIWNQPGDNAYPIAAYTYVIVYQDLGAIKDRNKARALVDFLTWATGEQGQRFAGEMDYAPLAPGVRQKVTEQLNKLTFGGNRLGVAAAR